ncbi:MAG: DUF881 domain-containing protein [Nocardioidaceae bacterium]
MSLLQELARHAVDDDYYNVAERSEAERSGRADLRWVTLAVLAVFALLVVVAAVQTRLDRPAAESERAALIDQIESQKQHVSSRQKRVTALRTDVAALRAESPDETARRRIQDQKVTTGLVAVTGPGVRVVVDNADASEDNRQGRVLDQDLQLLVNGLWLAGAEAISVNGNRLTTLSSIRTAGEAITVNYKSLTRPYVVSAIGDPKTLQARFIDTRAGQTWTNLRDNFGLRFQMGVRTGLDLPAAPEKRSRVRVAHRMEGAE